MKVYNFLIRNLLKHNIKKHAQNYLSGKLLDIGCGTKQYKDILAPIVSEHVGVDYSETLHGIENADIVATAYDIPVDDGSYDSVLCTEVIEHLEEPEKAFEEIIRVLKPGGYALVTNPFIWHLHEEPRDFYRYSKYGLEFLAKKKGFEVILIEAIGGFWITFGQLFVYWLHTYNKGIIRYTMLIPAIGVVVQLLAFGLNKISYRPQWCSHYISVFRKPA